MRLSGNSLFVISVPMPSSFKLIFSHIFYLSLGGILAEKLFNLPHNIKQEIRNALHSFLK